MIKLIKGIKNWLEEERERPYTRWNPPAKSDPPTPPPPPPSNSRDNQVIKLEIKIK